VNQYGIVPVAPGAGGGELSPPVGDNVEAILARFTDEEIVGDAAHGEAIYKNLQPSGRNSLLGCGGCHLGGLVAPATEETWDNILNIRLNDPQLEGYTPEQYIVESIVSPGAYIVPTYSDGQMPPDFAQRMSTQDLADIIAYLKSFSEDSGD
jgi:mono/diheme cytochrome c family protein